MKENQFTTENEILSFESETVEQQKDVKNEEKPEIFSETTKIEEPVFQEELVVTEELQEEENALQHEESVLEVQQDSKSPFVQEENTLFSQTLQQETNFVPIQGNMVFSNDEQFKLKPKKKTTLIVISIVTLVLLVLSGLYGFSVYTKSQSLQTVKISRDTLKGKSDEVKSQVTKLEMLDKLKEFETCVYDDRDNGVQKGMVFQFRLSNSYELVEKSESQFKEQLNRCKEIVSDLENKEIQEKIDAEIKKIEEAYKTNTQYLDEAKTVSNQWQEFKAAWKSGAIEEIEFNRIRNLAATAMGVEPSTLGDNFKYLDISVGVFKRMKSIENKQTLVSSLEVKKIILENMDGEYYPNIKESYEAKQDELEKINRELDKKEKEVKEKESKLWNPFR